MRVVPSSGVRSAVWICTHGQSSPQDTSTPGEGVTRIGLALEPMTCAPDAFNDANYEYDTGLVRLEPGATHEASWTIAAI